MAQTLSAVDTMVRLTQLRHSTVVTNQKGASHFPVSGILPAFWHITFIHALVVVQQYGRNVYTIGTWHTIFAVIARYGGILLYKFCRVEEEIRGHMKKRVYSLLQ